MTNVLVVAAAELGDPIVRFVLVKSDDRAQHRRSCSRRCRR
jgi:hypothetical protein